MKIRMTFVRTSSFSGFLSIVLVPQRVAAENKIDDVLGKSMWGPGSVCPSGLRSNTQFLCLYVNIYITTIKRGYVDMTTPVKSFKSKEKR